MMYLTLLWVLLISTLTIEYILTKFSRSLSKRIKTVISSVLVVLISSVYTALFGVTLSVFALLLFLVGIFRLVHISRFFVDRLKIGELAFRSKASTEVFILLHIIIVSLWVIDTKYEVTWNVIMAGVSMSVSVLLSVVLYGNIRKSSLSKTEDVALSDADSPTVSVCIPARNETEDLPFVISSVIENSYQKLEILVLDDCSHDKTPEIIKSYAHKGVRFIKGVEPTEEWLPKNGAYNKLFDESTAKYLLFMGVDVRLQSETIRNAVAYAINNDLDMLSVLPTRASGSGDSLLQIIRYWWELSVPSFMKKNRPPALSTFWLVRKKALADLGGFEAYRKSVTPENHFAKRLGNKYKFVFSRVGSIIDVSSAKTNREQRQTAVRVRYPSLRRRPEVVALLVFVQSVTLVSFVSSVAVSRDMSAMLLAGIALLVQSILYIRVAFLMHSVNVKHFVFAPILPIIDVFQSLLSMYKYEFGTVTWKERNICMPVLKYERSLPPIDVK